MLQCDDIGSSDDPTVINVPGSPSPHDQRIYVHSDDIGNELESIRDVRSVTPDFIPFRQSTPEPQQQQRQQRRTSTIDTQHMEQLRRQRRPQTPPRHRQQRHRRSSPRRAAEPSRRRRPRSRSPRDRQRRRYNNSNRSSNCRQRYPNRIESDLNGQYVF